MAHATYTQNNFAMIISLSVDDYWSPKALKLLFLIVSTGLVLRESHISIINPVFRIRKRELFPHPTEDFLKIRKFCRAAMFFVEKMKKKAQVAIIGSAF